jgi:hypothetical protein
MTSYVKASCSIDALGVSSNSAVRFDVMLRRMLGVFGSVNVMTVSQVGVVSSRFVVAFLVMTGGFVVVARSVLMMLRCLLVMMRCFVGHGNSSRRAVLSRHVRIIGAPSCGLGYNIANSR